MRKLYITKNLGNRGYQIESEDGRFVNRISSEALAEIVKKGAVNGVKVVIVNMLDDDQEIEIFDVVIEDYETDFDVVTTKIIITEDSAEAEFKVLDDYCKSYKKESAAQKYADKVREEIKFLYS